MKGSYMELRVTAGERVSGFVPRLVDILETRVTLLGKQILEPGMDERSSDRVRGQAYEISLLLTELKRGAVDGSPSRIQSPTGAD